MGGARTGIFSRLQRSIVTQAAEMLRPGGMLLYSTCTFDALENEGTIAYLMEKYPEFEICEIRPYEGFAHGRPDCAPGGQADFRKTVRIFPHHMKGEGHYLALLKKGKPKKRKVPIMGSIPNQTRLKSLSRMIWRCF